MASLVHFSCFMPNYFQANWKFDKEFWKKMMKYGLPILIAGISFCNQ